MTSELEALRQETEQLKNQIRVSVLLFNFNFILYINLFNKTTSESNHQTTEENTGMSSIFIKQNIKGFQKKTENEARN